MHAITRCNIGDIVISDHAIVMLDICVRGFLRPVRSWRFNNLLLKDDTFHSYFNSEFKIFLSINSESTNNPSLLWETTKAYIRGLAISYFATKKRKQLEKEKQLESELNTATSSYLNDPSPALLEKISAVRTSLNSLLTFQSHSNICYSKQKLYEWGNKPSKYLAYLTKSNSDSQFITSIVDIYYFDPIIINNIFKQFYSVISLIILPKNMTTWYLSLIA